TGPCPLPLCNHFRVKHINLIIGWLPGYLILQTVLIACYMKKSISIGSTVTHGSIGYTPLIKCSRIPIAGSCPHIILVVWFFLMPAVFTGIKMLRLGVHMCRK